MTAAVIGLAMVVALLAVLVVGLLRTHADILRSLHDLGVGEDALGTTGARPRPRGRSGPALPPPASGLRAGPHDLVGATPDGGVASVAIEGTVRSTLLAFLSTSCATCADFWRALGSDERRRVPGGDADVVIVTRDADEESPSAVARLAPTDVTTLMSSVAWDDYDVPGSPYFVLVHGQEGVIAEGTNTTWASVVELLERALADGGLLLQPAEGPSRREVLTGRRAVARSDRVIGGVDDPASDPAMTADG
ncbi:MAG: hypothetical protein ABWZ52_01640 [Acidimicrobiales bacterium]